MMIIKRLAMALTFLGCIEAYAVSPPAPTYTVTDIGVLPGFDECRGNTIDASGNVVGYCFKFGSAAVQHAFVYRDGKLVDLGAIFNPALATEALYTNIRGDIVLAQSPTVQYPSLISSDEQPVLYRNGSFTPLTFPHGGVGSVAGLNDFGQIAGNYTVGGTLYAYIVQPNGFLETIPTYERLRFAGFSNRDELQDSKPFREAIAVQGITAFGQVYGGVEKEPAPSAEQLAAEYATVFSDYVVTNPFNGQTFMISGTELFEQLQVEFPALTATASNAVLASAHGIRIKLGTAYGNGPTYLLSNNQGFYSGNGTFSVAFNNIGHFVDVSQKISKSPPFPSYLPVLHIGSRKVDLVPPDTEGLTGLVWSVTGINDFDTVVGYSIGNDSPLPLFNWLPFGFSPEINPFLYINGKMYDPNTLIPNSPIVSPAAVIIYQLLGVNDAGQILALGVERGNRHTLILNPVCR
jgi:probable HAF family extracellular repeat protein